MVKKQKKNKKEHREYTMRQKLLVQLFTENLGNIGRGEKSLSLQDILLKAGYSAASARQQSNILAGVQSKLDPVVNQLIDKRDMALNYMTERKFKKTGLSTLAYIVDIFTKNTELLSGRATERNAVLSDEERDKIMALKNRK